MKQTPNQDVRPLDGRCEGSKLEYPTNNTPLYLRDKEDYVQSANDPSLLRGEGREKLWQQTIVTKRAKQEDFFVTGVTPHLAVSERIFRDSTQQLNTWQRMKEEYERNYRNLIDGR